MYVDFKEAAKVLGVHYNTIKRWTDKLKIKTPSAPKKLKHVTREVKMVPFRELVSKLTDAKVLPFSQVESSNNIPSTKK